MLAGVLLAAILWRTRETIHFLGDTILRTRAIQYIASGLPMPRDYSILHAAPLDKWLLVGIPGFIGRLIPQDPLLFARLLPCALGAVFVLGSYWLACELTRHPVIRALVVIFLVTQGYLQLFAGYLEAYGLQIVTLLLWFAAIAREARRGTPVFWSSVFFGLAVLSHRDDLLLAPAQLWWLWNSRPTAKGEGVSSAVGAPGRSWWMAGIAVGVGAVIYTGLEWWPGLSGDLGFLAASGSQGAQAGAYPLVSWTHFANVLNNLFLLAPAGLVTTLIFFRVPEAEFRSPTFRALVLAGAPFLILIASVRSIYRGIGAVRDWDAFAPAGLVLALFAVLQILRLLELRPRLMPLAWSLTFASGVFMSSWIAINANPAWAIARADAVVHAGPLMPASPRSAALETLAQVQMERGEHPVAASLLEEAVNLTPNPRLIWLTGTEEWRAGNESRARKLFRWAAGRDPVFRARMEGAVRSDLAASPLDSLSRAMLQEIVSERDRASSGAQVH